MADPLARFAAAQLTYPEVGASLGEPLPPGYDHLRREATVGRGRPAFDAAADALLGWHLHRRAGFRVVSSAGTAAVGGVVVLRVGPLTVPCRVVSTVAEDSRRGFAYGTLPGHPERGEEAFVVSLTPAGEVRFAVRAFSRPATLLARAGGPVTRLVQRYATGRYLDAMGALVRAASAGP